MLLSMFLQMAVRVFPDEGSYCEITGVGMELVQNQEQYWPEWNTTGYCKSSPVLWE